MKSTIIKLTKITVAKTIKVNAIVTRDIYDYITFNDGCNIIILPKMFTKNLLNQVMYFVIQHMSFNLILLLLKVHLVLMKMERL